MVYSRIKKLRKFVSEPSSRRSFLESDTERFELKLNEGAYRGSANCLISIGRNWYARMGLIDLVDNLGAEQLYKSVWITYVGRIVNLEFWRGLVRRNKGMGAEDYMQLMHSLLMFGRWKEAYPLAKEIYEKNGDHDPLGTGQDDPFCGFTLKLIAVLAGENPAVTAQEAKRFGLGDYQGLFDHWNDPQALEHAIAKACDDRMRRSQMEYSVIASPPIDLLPMEILAYVRVRERMGLETILPDHEALTNPMVCNLPRDLPVIEDDLIRRVVVAAQKEYPEIEYPNDEGTQEVAWKIDFEKRIPFVTKRRKPVELDRALLTGNEDQIDETVGDSYLTLIVDWKDTPRQVLETVVKLVPDFDWESDGQHDFTLKFCGRSLAVEHDPTKKYIAHIVAGVAQVLEPEWEMRRYQPSKDDDTVVYVARPAEFWREFDKKAKTKSRRLFDQL